MQLNLERPDHEFFLRSADGDSALVNDRRLQDSFVLAPDRQIDDWSPREASTLAPGDMEPLLALEPEVILLGTGATQVFPSAATLAACLSRGVGVEVMTNAAAARTFNVLAGEGRRVVADFLIAAG